MEETYQQKKRRLHGKLLMPEYLKILNKLFLEEIKYSDLLSIVETDRFIASTRLLKKNGVCYKKSIDFSNKTELKKIIKEELSDWNNSYVVYTSKSLDCGLLKIPTLSWFNWNFSFEDDPGGLISFTRIDGAEYCMLDYYKEKDNNVIEIEIYRQ